MGPGGRKFLEPSNIAPSWIPMDDRCDAVNSLRDRFYATSVAELDA